MMIFTFCSNRERKARIGSLGWGLDHFVNWGTWRRPIGDDIVSTWSREPITKLASITRNRLRKNRRLDFFFLHFRRSSKLTEMSPTHVIATTGWENYSIMHHSGVFTWANRLRHSTLDRCVDSRSRTRKMPFELHDRKCITFPRLNSPFRLVCKRQNEKPRHRRP